MPILIKAIPALEDPQRVGPLELVVVLNHKLHVQFLDILDGVEEGLIAHSRDALGQILYALRLDFCEVAVDVFDPLARPSSGLDAFIGYPWFGLRSFASFL